MKKPCFVFSSSPEYEKWFTWFRRAYLHNTMLWKQRELVIWMTNPKKKSETYKHKFPWWKSSILFKYGIPPPLPSNICFAFLPSFYFKTSFERSTSQSSKLSKIFGTFSKRYAFFLFSIWAWMGQIQWNEISNLRQKNHKWILQKLGRFQLESNFFFRLLCVSIVVLLLAMCASAVITWGKALWDSEPFPESKLSEAEWYMYFYS